MKRESEVSLFFRNIKVIKIVIFDAKQTQSNKQSLEGNKRKKNRKWKVESFNFDPIRTKYEYISEKNNSVKYLNLNSLSRIF